jgi:Xaa-Pro aminopeptidase
MQSTPFSAAKLDTLLDESGIDVLLVSSKHNVQYLLDGYRYYFFEHLDTIGLGRYLPILGYVKGRLDQAFYVGSEDEAWEVEVFPFWPERISTEAWTSSESARLAADMARMAVLGEPTALMKELLEEVSYVQAAARVPIKAGSL